MISTPRSWEVHPFTGHGGLPERRALLILYSQLHIMLGAAPPAAAVGPLYAALADAKISHLALGAATVAVIWIGPRLSRRLPRRCSACSSPRLVYYLLVAAGLKRSSDQP